MSAIGEAFRALKQVVLMQSDLEKLQASVTQLGADVKGLSAGLGAVNNRVARLEGFIEGATAAGRAQPRLPEE